MSSALKVPVRPPSGRGSACLLTGHTGFKGAWAALWLREMGADVTGFALAPDEPESPCALIWRDRAEGSARLGDLRDPRRVLRCIVTHAARNRPPYGGAAHRAAHLCRTHRNAGHEHSQGYGAPSRMRAHLRGLKTILVVITRTRFTPTTKPAAVCRERQARR